MLLNFSLPNFLLKLLPPFEIKKGIYKVSQDSYGCMNNFSLAYLCKKQNWDEATLMADKLIEHASSPLELINALHNRAYIAQKQKNYHLAIELRTKLLNIVDNNFKKQFNIDLILLIIYGRPIRI